VPAGLWAHRLRHNCFLRMPLAPPIQYEAEKETADACDDEVPGYETENCSHDEQQNGAENPVNLPHTPRQFSLHSLLNSESFSCGVRFRKIPATAWNATSALFQCAQASGDRLHFF